MADRERDDDVQIEHPNRKKASSKLARVVVFVLLVASAALLIIASLGGWGETQGARGVQVALILVYLVLAFFVLRWSSGVLPMSAAIAIIVAIFAAVSVPGWFERDKDGFATTALDANIMGLLCILIVIVQVVLIVAAMLAFRQGWGVEVERRADGSTHAVPSAA